MKKQMILIALFIITCFGYNSSNAQVGIQFNIGIQPLWGPVGYEHVDYYYIPDIDVYYDVPRGQYVYYEGNRWIYTAALPPRYGNYDLYHGYKVVINERQPWLRNDVYRNQYSGYRGRHDQQIIRDSREEKYWENKNHPEHNKWHGDHGNGHEHQDNGHHNDDHHNDDHHNEGSHGHH